MSEPPAQPAFAHPPGGHGGHRGNLRYVIYGAERLFDERAGLNVPVILKQCRRVHATINVNHCM